MFGFVFGVLVILGFSLAIYFIPSITAKENGKKDAKAIFALNLLLGWTVIGWVAALVWALTKDAPAQPVWNAARPLVPSQTPGQKKCPDCAEMVLAEARKCRFCSHEFISATHMF